ncbi:uncharacterized protein [Choristoneura fumiferana]|uniref:uncharacterized protein n=1 Tax=Choristoneura fumiferana TaxID=7141 RepID=UPI003D154D6D
MERADSGDLVCYACSLDLGVGEEYLQCMIEKCRKLYHHLCTNKKLTPKERETWVCPECCNELRKGGRNYETPVGTPVTTKNISTRNKSETPVLHGQSPGVVPALALELQLTRDQMIMLNERLADAVSTIVQCQAALAECAKKFESVNYRLLQLEQEKECNASPPLSIHESPACRDSGASVSKDDGKTDASNGDSLDENEEGWQEVNSRKKRVASVRGTAGPEKTTLKAVEYRRSIHLWNMVSGGDDILAYLQSLKPGKTFTVDELKPKGLYKSFKIGVPAEMFDECLTAEIWPENARNVRGLNTKLRQFRLNILSLDCDIVSVTETFLTGAVHDSELVECGWSVLRRDRATGARGGGVLIAARPGLVLRRRRDLESPAGEDLWVTFVHDSVTFYLCVIYIPPSVIDEVYMRWFQSLETVINSLNGVVVVTGDLNLNPLYKSHSLLSYYCYFLTVCGLCEKNEVRNAYDGKLDVVLVSDRIKDVRVVEIDGGGLVLHRDVYHPPLEISIPISSGVKRSPAGSVDPSNVDMRKDWNFAKGDFELLYTLFSEVCWDDVLQSQDVEVAVDILYSTIYRIFDICIPKKVRPKIPTRRYPVWFDADLIKAVKAKAVLHKNGKRPRTWIFMRSSVSLGDTLRNGSLPRMTITLFMSSLRSRGGFTDQVTFDGEQFTGQDAAFAFASFFSSVFLPDVPRLDGNDTGNRGRGCYANLVNISNISKTDVGAAIKRLKPNSSLGPDCLPAYIIKGCADHLKAPLVHIFNLSLCTGTYPHQWKVTRVKPIPKSGDASEVENRVSQGSILGPLLFGIMINDLESSVRFAKCLLYADDLKLVYRVGHERDCHDLQEDISSVYRWSIKNKLEFNDAKCQVCTFSRSSTPIHNEYMLGSVGIERVFSVKDLGVVFDTRLTFHEHIRTLATDCFRRLGFVIRNVKGFRDVNTIKLVYTALVRSKLESSSIVWSPYESTYALLLEKVQKAFLRFLYKKRYGYYPFLYPTQFLLGALGLNSLEVRRNHSLLMTTCRILRGESDCPELVARLVRLFVPNIPRIELRPRARALLAVPAARTAARRGSPLPGRWRCLMRFWYPRRTLTC